ncbi:hypothetical protein HHK36_000178 [Tetracentron sinense]|uniref:Uncharacterized protein n=1 Tax=Tetracentron sinense TaxID=13715 RepID=A0A835DQN5_TETSI|nr:hypothetical protein HHK36_000178 [Tetracentron sinense]
MATQARDRIQDQNFSVAYKAHKKVGHGGRKALFDVTNKGKPSSHLESKKNHFKKLDATGGEIDVSKAIPSFGGKSMFLDHCLLLGGLTLSLEPESPSRYLELEQKAELPDEYWSPPQCRTPKSLNSSPDWNDYHFPNSMLKETPRLPKH